jgi:hypothetical protein
MLTVLGVSGDIRSDAELAAVWSAVVWRAIEIYFARRAADIYPKSASGFYQARSLCSP